MSDPPDSAGEPQASTGGKGTGSVRQGAAAVGEALIGAAQATPAGTADPDVSVAFALGWQMAELYRPRNLRKYEARPGDLPGLGSLGEADRLEILIDQIQAGITKLKGPIEQAGFPTPEVAPLRAVFGATEAERSSQVLALHRSVLGTLTACDFRLGKAYGLGRALADTCLKPADEASVEAALDPQRLANLLAWLDDLSSALPPHSGHSVATALERWRDWAPRGASQPINYTLAALRHQGQLWRALLSGERAATTMLEIANYLDAARELAQQLRALLRGVVRRFPVLTAVVVVLFAGGIALLATDGASHLVAGATSIVAALGLTWRGLGGAVGQLVGHVEQPLWGAVLDAAIADAITLLPENKKDARGRRALALQMPSPHHEPSSTSTQPNRRHRRRDSRGQSVSRNMARTPQI